MSSHCNVEAALALVCIISLISCGSTASSCDGHLQAFLEGQKHEPQPYTGKNMVYFLHVPRTGGRTFHTCILKQAFPLAVRCDKAYDRNINTTLSGCNLLSSHDDFSVIDNLPQDTAVVNQMRDPVERFLSAYEFAIEVAARPAVRPPASKQGKLNAKNKGKVLTENVWPWSHLLPFFESDIRSRMAELNKTSAPPSPEHWHEVINRDGSVAYYNKVYNISKPQLSEAERQKLLPALDPYHNPLYTPLEQFVDHPIAKELIHNGIFFQVLGITNYSHWSYANDVRECSWQSPSVYATLLELAGKRMMRFTHLGTTDRLQESVESCAASLYTKLDKPAFSGPVLAEAAKAAARQAAQPKHHRRLQAQQGSSSRQHHPGGLPLSSTDSHERAAQEAHVLSKLRKLQAQAPSKSPSPSPAPARPLGESYMDCAARAQARNKNRKYDALARLQLPDGRWPMFTKASRAAIPEALLERIRSLNTADSVLHKLALELLDKTRGRHTEDGALQQLGPAPETAARARAPAKAGATKQ